MYIYIYIYAHVYVYVCMCVCICIRGERLLNFVPFRAMSTTPQDLSHLSLQIPIADDALVLRH